MDFQQKFKTNWHCKTYILAPNYDFENSEKLTIFKFVLINRDSIWLENFI